MVSGVGVMVFTVAGRVAGTMFGTDDSGAVEVELSTTLMSRELSDVGPGKIGWTRDDGAVGWCNRCCHGVEDSLGFFFDRVG